VPRLRWHVTADNHRAENSDHHDAAAAEVCYRTAIRATTATETARPTVPRGSAYQLKNPKNGHSSRPVAGNFSPYFRREFSVAGQRQGKVMIAGRRCKTIAFVAIFALTTFGALATASAGPSHPYYESSCQVPVPGLGRHRGGLAALVWLIGGGRWRRYSQSSRRLGPPWWRLIQSSP
jgi:hypothetical protein